MRERSSTQSDVGSQGAALKLSKVGALSCLELRRSFSGELLLQVGSRAIGTGTMADHGGSKVGVRCEGLRPKVVEHGIRAPRPRTWVAVESTPAHRRAVAPPGRRPLTDRR